MVAMNERVSPQLMARAGGACWLMTIVTGSLALFAKGRAGTAVNLVSTGFYAAATVFVYFLLKPVSRGLSLLALFFSFLGCALGVLRVFHLAPNSVNPLGLFGLHCLLVGVLILRSTFLPRVLGALMAFAALGWVTFFWPPLAQRLAPYNLAPGILGEAALSLWLLVKGVNVTKWREASS